MEEAWQGRKPSRRVTGVVPSSRENIGPFFLKWNGVQERRRAATFFVQQI